MFSFSKNDRYHDHRVGLTLIELMVALMVISILAAIALPSVKNSLREQKVTRAASLVQSAIEEGRARSIGSGGGGGVIIDRVGDANLSQACESVRIRFASGASQYSGETGSARCLVAVVPGATVMLDQVALWVPNSALQLERSRRDIEAGSGPTLINQGDFIQLGDAGLPLVIDQLVRGSNTLVASDGIVLPSGVATDWNRVSISRSEINQNLRRFAGTQIPFVITRSPRPAIAASISLPKGTSIDLTSSGVGRFGFQFSPFAIENNFLDSSNSPFIAPFLRPTIPPEPSWDYRSVWIVFGSRGEVSQVLIGNDASPPVLTSLPVTGDIHLLVGRAGQVRTEPSEQLEDTDSDPFADEAKDGKTPLLDSESIWVTIKARTGEVLTSPWVDPTDDAFALIPNQGTTPTFNNDQRTRLQTVIGRTRAAAIASRDQGSL